MLKLIIDNNILDMYYSLVNSVNLLD